jgi:predicted tellurium resistance membrane protein TerC
MSLDNVVAIAAIAQGSVVYIAIGLALSIPMLIWGSNLIRELLDESGLLVLASGAFLGWVAGGVAVADPLVAGSISAYAPALAYAIPAACAIFVLCQNLILDPRRARLRGSHAE